MWRRVGFAGGRGGNFHITLKVSAEGREVEEGEGSALNQGSKV